jgi:hypothetical protein
MRSRRQTDARFVEFITAFIGGEGFVWVASFMNQLARGEVKIDKLQSQFFRIKVGAVR